MSHTDNTAQKFDTNFPEWLAWKLIAKQDEQGVGTSRHTSKQIWRKEIETELSE